MGIFLVIMLLLFMVLKGIEEFKCLVDIDDYKIKCGLFRMVN